jgi:hypothetical protein
LTKSQQDNLNDSGVGVNADTQRLYKGPKHQDTLLTGHKPSV